MDFSFLSDGFFSLSRPTTGVIHFGAAGGSSKPVAQSRCGPPREAEVPDRPIRRVSSACSRVDDDRTGTSCLLRSINISGWSQQRGREKEREIRRVLSDNGVASLLWVVAARGASGCAPRASRARSDGWTIFGTQTASDVSEMRAHRDAVSRRARPDGAICLFSRGNARRSNSLGTNVIAG